MNRVKQLVHAENVYRMGYTGKNIRVVTLDTGVYLHPDLRQNVVGFLDFVAMKRACYDDNGHGTNGAPYRMRDVLEDMEAAERGIENLLDAIKEMDEE